MKFGFYLSLLLVVSLYACKTTESVTPYEYALLSAHVYNDGTKNLPPKFETLASFDENEKSVSDHLGGFLNALDMGKVVELSNAEEKKELIAYLSMKAISTGGYYGQAYFDRKSKTVIIAHRGTDNLIHAFTEEQKGKRKVVRKIWEMVKDLDDDYEIYNGKIPKQQFLDAQEFTEQVKKTYREQFNEEARIVHTGHSLGALLGELCAVADNGKAVTFESPGIFTLLQELESLTFGKFEYENFKAEKADITCYLVEPNRINTLHPKVGKVIPLYKTTKDQKFSGEEYLFENIKMHAIDSLLLRFDPKTGKPLSFK